MRSLNTILGGVLLVACGARTGLAVNEDPVPTPSRDAGMVDDAGSLPPPAVPFLQITTGRHHACALDDTGGVVCWGDNRHGELADSALVESATPVVIDVPPSIAIDAAHDQTCVVTVEGEVWCWGPTPSPRPAVPPESEALSLGGGSICLLGSEGAVRCDRQLGDGSRDFDVRIEVGARDVAVGPSHGCAALPSGVRCFGDNPRGELGVEPFRVGREPGPTVSVPGVGGAVAVAAGINHSCAVTVDGAVFCWGGNHAGQVGLPARDEVFPPTEVSGLAGAEDIDAGWEYTCAIVRGDLHCWGLGSRGQLGTGDEHLLSQPPTRVDLRGPVRSVSTGVSFACAIDGTGRAFCWGDNLRGQLGDGTFEDRDRPTPILP